MSRCVLKVVERLDRISFPALQGESNEAGAGIPSDFAEPHPAGIYMSIYGYLYVLSELTTFLKALEHQLHGSC